MVDETSSNEFAPSEAEMMRRELWRAINPDGDTTSEAIVEKVCAIIARRSPSPAVEGGWRDIATAPKDGWIIVYCPAAHGLPEMVCPCRYHSDGGFCVCEIREPTHWQPLPTPPAGEKP